MSGTRSRQDADAKGGDDVQVTVAIINGQEADAAVATLDSVASQTHGAIELLRVDAAGGDAGAWFEDGLARHAGRFARSQRLQAQADASLGETCNLAFAAAQSEAVMVLAPGDVLHPRALQRLLQALRQAGAACAYPQILTASGEVGENNVWSLETLRRSDCVGPIALVRRDAWVQVGGYAALDHSWAGRDFWCNLVEAGASGVYVPELLVRSAGQVKLSASEEAWERGRLFHWLSAQHPWIEARL